MVTVGSGVGAGAVCTGDGVGSGVGIVVDGCFKSETLSPVISSIESEVL